MTKFDYIVIGAGSSGCALVNQLVQSGRTVLLIEAGGRDRSPSIRLPGGIFRAMLKHDWGYVSAPDPTRREQGERWFRGRVLGGSSSINGMVYVRGAACDYEHWQQMGNEGWGRDESMPLFEEMERCDRSSSTGAAQRRGRTGPVHVRMVKQCHRLTEAFVNAVQSAGNPFNQDYNGATQMGVGYVQLTQRHSRRWSAADAFLKPVLGRENLQLVMNALVHRVLLQERRALGVQYEREGTMHHAYADHVVLCAGVINTPKLLMLSGIGDSASLSEHGIAPVLDRKAVGQGLMEHPLVRLIYRTTISSHNPTGGFAQKVRLLAKYLVAGQGLFASVFEAMIFLKTSPVEHMSAIQVLFAPIGLDAQHSATSPLGILPYPSLLTSVKQNYPFSRGRVLLACADLKLPPIIEPCLLASHHDADTLVRGVLAVRRIMASAPMADLVAEEVSPGRQCANASSLAEHVRQQATVAYHPVGTCRMGVDDEAVLTPQLQVRGIENLWVADASIMPTHISGNPNAACMMIGTKLGKQLSSAAARVLR